MIREAGVSRATFYAHFSDKRDCVRRAQTRAFDALSARVFHVCVARTEWPVKVEASVRTAVEFAAADPDRARLLLVDAVGADPELAAQARAATEHFVRLLRAGREQCAAAAELPDLTERALVGSVASTIGERLMSGRPDLVSSLAPDLIQLTLLSYVGPEEARRLAAAPA